jgi:RNA polymerase sigma factor (TIGR02999 family)
MPTSIVDLLQRVEAGGKVSLDAVMPQVYEELHRLASSYMRHERNSHTLQPTALVNETYLRLIGQHSVDFANRAQLLGVAAQMMRRILKTHEEKRSTDRGEETRPSCASMTHRSQPPLRSSSSAKSMRCSIAWPRWIVARRRWQSCASLAVLLPRR